MRLIILILANDTEVYLEMQKIWKIYMKTHPNIKSFFIKYKEQLVDDIILTDDTIFIKGKESIIPGCLDKTIKSIEFLLKNMDFDFIFRTNMSSVVDLNKMYNLLNENIECAGVVGNYYGQKFVSGAGMLMNKKLCELLINNKSSINYNVIDDVSIGKILTDKNINIIELTRFETYNYQNNIELVNNDMIKNYYHFRCKSDLNHKNTVSLMKKIIKLIY
jgi:hypothetical protein